MKVWIDEHYTDEDDALASATTGQDGRFDPMAVKPGRLEIRISGFGWEPSAHPIFVPPSHDPVDRVVEILARRARMISARVVDEKHRPVAGARIRMNPGGPVRATSDAGGAFDWPLDEEGDLWAYPEKEGYVRSDYLGDDDPPRGVVVLYRADSDEGRRLLEAPKKRSVIPAVRPPWDGPTMPVRVRVRTEEGRPAVGARIEVSYGIALDAAGGREAFADEEGAATVEIRRLPDEWYPIDIDIEVEHLHEPIIHRYTVTAGPVEVDVTLDPPPRTAAFAIRDAAGNPIPDAWIVGSKGAWLADEKGVVRGVDRTFRYYTAGAPGFETVGVWERRSSESRVVVLEREAFVRGVVRDAGGRPRPGVPVEAPGFRGVTDAKGRFRIGGAGRGEVVRVEVAPPDFPYPGYGAELVAGDPEAVISLPAIGTIRFQADPDLPDPPYASDALIQVVQPVLREGWSEHDHLALARTTPSGWVCRLPPGPWIVLLGGEMQYASELVRVEAGRETRLRLRKPHPKRVEGRVTDSSGRPLEGVDVADALMEEGIGTTDADGRFFFSPVVFGERLAYARLLFEADGQADHLTDLLDLRAAPVLSIRMSPGGRLRVHVRDRSGRPVEGVDVAQIDDLGEERVNDYTDEAGGVLLERVAPGRRRISILPERGFRVLRTVTVEEGETTELTVTIPSR